MVGRIGLLAACAAWWTPAVALEGGAAPQHANLVKLGYAHFAFDDEAGLLEGTLVPPDSTIDVLNTGTPAGTYTRFIGDHLGAEVLFGLPVEIDIDGAGFIEDRGRLATVKALPPTAILGFYPFGRDRALRPYAAIGVNHTIFYGAEATESLEAVALGEPDIELESSTGIAGFLGLNARITDRYFASALVGYVDIDTQASLPTETFFTQSDGSRVSLGVLDREIEVQVDPYVFIGMIGVSF